MKYLVEIIPESITDREAAASSLAATLKIDTAKAASLLKRNPVTKPVSQAEAEKVARLFTKAGIEVFVRGEEEITSVVANPSSQAHESLKPSHVEMTTPDTHVVQANEVPTQIIGAKILSPNLITTEPGLAPATPTVKASTIVPETQKPNAAPEPDAFQTKSIQGEETLKIPSGFFTPVPEGAVTSPSEDSSPELPPLTEAAPKARAGLGKIAFASIVPGLLALAGVFTALYLLGLPFLQSQQRTSAETAAVALANSVGGWIGDVTLDNPALSGQLQNVIARTQGELRGRGIDLVMLTDSEGNQLAGWYKDAQIVPEDIAGAEIIRAQISNAIGGAVAATTDTPLGDSNANTRLNIDNEVLGLASAAVRQGNKPVGSVVVGSSEQTLMSRVQQLFPTLALAGLLPLLLGILLSLLIGRNRS